MRYLSLFSGIEAASVAFMPLGWEPVAFAEIEPFPCAVLAHRFPNVPNLGDVCKIDWKEFYEQYGAVDVLIGGSPCQSFSIAGNREGLSGESRLMFEYIRAVQDLVRVSGGTSPRYIIWENVPGALSSERGFAFGQLLAELDECGYGLAWRILDAQFTRVPNGQGEFVGPVAQRRRRVFLVGVLGSPHAAEILFERESMSGDHPQGREARKALAEDAHGRPEVGNSAGFKYHQGASANGVGFEVENSPTLTADYHNPAVMSGVYSLSLANTNANGSNMNEDGASYTLDGANCNAVAFEQNQRGEVRLNNADGSITSALSSSPSGEGQGRSFICIENGQANAARDAEVSPTLNCDHEQPIIIDRAAFNQGENAKYPTHIEQSATMDTLVAGGLHAVCHRMASR